MRARQQCAPGLPTLPGTGSSCPELIPLHDRKGVTRPASWCVTIEGTRCAQSICWHTCSRPPCASDTPSAHTWRCFLTSGVVWDPGLLRVLPKSPSRSGSSSPGSSQEVGPPGSGTPLVTAVPFHWDHCSSGGSPPPRLQLRLRALAPFYGLFSARQNVIHRKLPVGCGECESSRVSSQQVSNRELHAQ